jgi:DNA-binding MarR family transcriptional regulator
MDQERDKSIGFLISYLTRQGHRYFELEFGVHGLNRGSIFFLKRLYKQDGVRQNELSNSLHYDKANITRIVQKLLELGFVLRDNDKDDKRAKKIFLTEKAKKFEPTFKAIFEGWGTIISKDFQPEDEEKIWRFLKQMSENTKQYFKENK